MLFNALNRFKLSVVPSNPSPKQCRLLDLPYSPITCTNVERSASKILFERAINDNKLTMGKILAVALAALLVLASDAAADPSRRLRLDKRKLMENAVRVNSKGERHLEQEDFELSAGYSIQFQQCVSLKTEPYDDDILFAESLLAYTAKGQVVSQKSYILFNVCETQKCTYEGDDNTFMVDIDTYVASISEFYLDMKENYCDACQSSANYCRCVH